MSVTDGATSEVGGDGNDVAGEFVVHNFNAFIVRQTHDLGENRTGNATDEFVDGRHWSKC